MKKLWKVFLLIMVTVTLILPVNANTDDALCTVDMLRLYNPNSGEHFYTASAEEKNILVSAGWKYEGVGWTAPEKSSTPVYRLYNPNAGDHHYTLNEAEKNSLESVGWKYEGIGWYSADTDYSDWKYSKVQLYRQYNPNAAAGSHNYTSNTAERDMLIKAGWKDEGNAWMGLQADSSSQSAFTPIEPTPTPEAVETAAPTRSNTGGSSSYSTADFSLLQYEKPASGDYYVVNTDSLKVHKRTCRWVYEMNSENEMYSTHTLEELENGGFTRCHTCH